MKRIALISWVAVAASIVSTTAWSQEKKPEDPLRNREYGKHLQSLQWFVGEWEITGQILIAGQPPIEIASRKTSEWTLGGNFISTTTIGEDPSGEEVIHKSIVGWDPDDELIKGWGFWNSGIYEVVEWSPEENKWHITRDGLKGVYTVLGPDKHHYEAEFQGDDGRMHRWHFTAQRVGSQGNRDCPWTLVTGKWQQTDHSGYTAEVVWEEAGDGNAVVGTWKDKNGAKYTELVGWDPNKRVLVATGYGTNGAGWELRANTVTESMIQGRIVDRRPDGTTYTGTWRCTKVNDDLIETQFVGSDGSDGEVEIRGSFKRQK